MSRRIYHLALACPAGLVETRRNVLVGVAGVDALFVPPVGNVASWAAAKGDVSYARVPALMMPSLGTMMTPSRMK